jgi:hypothetical protein
MGDKPYHPSPNSHQHRPGGNFVTCTCDHPKYLRVGTIPADEAHTRPPV